LRAETCQSHQGFLPEENVLPAAASAVPPVLRLIFDI